MKLKELKILYAIKNYKPISNTLLQEYLTDYGNTDFNTIMNLFYQSAIIVNDYIKFKLYVNNFINQYFSLYHIYTFPEQEWLKFYLILKFYDRNLPYHDLIVNDYKHLPPLIINSDYMKEIKNAVEDLMTLYYKN